MPLSRRLALTDAQRRELLDLRDHAPEPYLRERAAILSPDPDDDAKRADVEAVLAQARAAPGWVAALDALTGRVV